MTQAMQQIQEQAQTVYGRLEAWNPYPEPDGTTRSRTLILNPGDQCLNARGDVGPTSVRVLAYPDGIAQIEVKRDGEMPLSWSA